MIDWQIEYWCSTEEGTSAIETFLDQLTDEQFKSVAKELKLLELCGNGLFELRERKFGYRIYYMFAKNQVIILLHAGDKSSQTKDIKVAKQRLAEILKEVRI